MRRQMAAVQSRLDVHLALRQWRAAQPCRGRYRGLAHLSGRASLEKSMAEDSTCSSHGRGVFRRWLAASTTRHLEDSRNTYLDTVDHRRVLCSVFCALLDM